MIKIKEENLLKQFYNLRKRNKSLSKPRMMKEPTKEKFENLECLKIKISCMAR